MKVTSYSPVNGMLMLDSITGITFGNIRQGQHCTNPPVIKPSATSEIQFSEMKLFLQNDGGLAQSQFGYYKNSSFITGITGGHPSYFSPSNHFNVVTGPVLSDSLGLNISLDASGMPSEYVWLDVGIGALETGATSSINYRFLFDFT
jgi:hypothetical protein